MMRIISQKQMSYLKEALADSLVGIKRADAAKVNNHVAQIKS